MSGKREIRFRAWDKVNKKMWNDVWFDKTSIYWGWNEEKEQPEAIMPRDMIGELMQFTDLHAKNGKGKEVYEGDLIRVLSNGYEPRLTHEVIWDEERLEWGVRIVGGGTITSLWTFNKDFEVIGDIYSAPDLLKSA